MDAIRLIARIENAFDGAVRAETSLWQFQLTDRYGMSREITADEWAAAGKRRVDATWQQIQPMPGVSLKTNGLLTFQRRLICHPL
ncbi:DUF6714 family protein [Massilia sp. SR12]